MSIFSLIFILYLGEDGNTVKRRKKKIKAEGIYGHFFNDLSPYIKKLVLEIIRNNKRKIQKEGYKVKGVVDSKNKKKDKDKADSFLPKTNLQVSRDRVVFLSGAEYDTGTNTEKGRIYRLQITVLLHLI